MPAGPDRSLWCDGVCLESRIVPRERINLGIHRPFRQEVAMMSQHSSNTPTRRDRLLKQSHVDGYKSDRKLPEPTVCRICGAVFSAGRWQWSASLPETASEVRCPACQRIHDHLPAGYLTLSGDFFNEHRDEIMRLVHNHMERQRNEHPMQRIMEVKSLDTGGVEISFTEFHQPKSVGEAVRSAYQGELDIHYPEESGQERVAWRR
jgi:NMD protein affecting ribosome stability and mRNA decay